jgi:hypothetical protein
MSVSCETRFSCTLVTGTCDSRFVKQEFKLVQRSQLCIYVVCGIVNKEG